MSLREAMKAVGYAPKSPYCAFGDILDGLDEEDTADYEKMLADKASLKEFVKVFRKAGYEIGETAIRNHRNGGCKCRP